MTCPTAKSEIAMSGGYVGRWQLREFKDLVSLSREFFEEYGFHHEGFFTLAVLRDGDIVSYFSNLLGNDDGEVIVTLEEGRTVGYIAVCVRKQPG